MIYLKPDQACEHCNASPGFHTITCTDTPRTSWSLNMPTPQQKDTMNYNVTRKEAVTMMSNAMALLLESPQFKEAVRFAMTDDTKEAA